MTNKINIAVLLLTALVVTNIYKAIWCGICGYVFFVGFVLQIW